MPDTTHTTDIAFEIEGVSQRLHVFRLEGSEGLSELFQFQLALAVEEARAALSGVIGSPAKLTLRGGGGARSIHGIVSRFRQGASGQRHGVFHATFVPKAFALLHRQDARIFQAKTTPEIVQAVLEGAGLTSSDYRLALEASYSPREYCVQYRESDWAFVSRLCEEEGISYFFDGTDDATRVVFGDGTSAHGPIADPSTLPFRPPGGALASVDGLSSVEVVDALQPGKITLRDYNFEKPNLSLEASAAGESATELEVYEYPGGYAQPGDGKRLARLRLEERAAALRTIEGESSVMRLCPGFSFALEDHPLEDLNAEYVVATLFHEGNQPLMGEVAAGGGPSYRARLSAFPASVPFRPPRLTPKPVVHIQTALCVGPDGQEIYTDEHGRVKVQFHWDRLGQKNDKSSTWMRVSQVWAGAGWGAMQLPRIGQEVVVDFLDGDVDRPLVVGRVYNGTNVPPYKLPDEMTKSTMRSLSSPDGEAGNELRFEDKKDAEELYLHAQKDLLIAVENDKAQTVGHDEKLEVTHDRSVKVGGDLKLEVTGNRTTQVDGDETMTVKGAQTETVSGDHALTIEGTSTVAVTKDTTVELKKKVGLTVGAAMTLEVKEDLTETITGKRTMTVDGEKFELTCGQSKLTVSQSGVEIEATEVKIKGLSSATLQGEAQVEVKASGQITVQASGMVQVKGAMVKVN